MRSALIIVGGLALLGVFVLVGRFVAAVGVATAAKAFIAVWLVVALVNMWMGVARGYSVGEELPIFLLIFAIPAAVAALVGWKLAA